MLAEKLFTGEEDFQKLREKSKYVVELVDKIVYMSPASTPDHQKIQRRLCSKFMTFLNGSKCESLQTINLRLYDGNSTKIGDVFPDLSIFNNLDNSNNAFIEDIPKIIAEVVSPPSIYLDNIDKALLYKKSGIEEYWIVNIKHKTITIWDFKNGEQYIYFDSDVCSSTTFVEFSVDLKELFI